MIASDIADVLEDVKHLNDQPGGWEPPKDAEGNILPTDQWDQNSWPLKLEDADRAMADGLAAAIRASLETGKTAGSIYNGSCSLGSSSGTVMGTFASLDASGGESAGADKIYDASQKMKNAGENADNDDLWQGIVDCCSAIVSKAKVNEILAGAVIPPVTPPPTVPAAGTGEGTLDDSAGTSVLLSALKGIPAAMGSAGSDAPFISLMATAVIAYFATIVVSMEGQGPLAGLKATNVLVGNM